MNQTKGQQKKRKKNSLLEVTVVFNPRGNGRSQDWWRGPWEEGRRGTITGNQKERRSGEAKKEFRHVTASANPVDVESLLESRYNRLFSEIRVKSTTFSRHSWERVRRRGERDVKSAAVYSLLTVPPFSAMVPTPLSFKYPTDPSQVTSWYIDFFSKVFKLK